MKNLRRNRSAILVCGVLTMLMFGTIYAWSIFIPPLEAEFGWTRSQTSLVFSVAMIGLSLGMLSVGQLTKVISLRACFVIATVLIAVGLFCCRFITELWQLYVLYGVFCGFGSGMSYTTWTTNTLAWFGDKVGFASGVLVMGFGMGALVLGSLASWLIYSVWGWRFAFTLIALMVCVEGAFALQYIQEPPKDIAALRPSRDDVGVSLPGSRTVREPSFWLFCLWRSVVMGSCGAVIAEASVMMTGIGSTVAFATAAVGALGLGNGIGRPLGGILYDKIGQNRTLVVLPTLAVMVTGGMALSYVSGVPELFALFLLADGLLYGMYAAINTSFMRTTFGQKNLATNTGISAVVLAPFNLVFPLIAALLFETTGGYEVFFCIVPILSAVSLMCGVLCKPATRRMQEREGVVGAGCVASACGKGK